MHVKHPGRGLACGEAQEVGAGAAWTLESNIMG